MATSHNAQLSQIETTCGSLLYELHMIWDEVGEYNAERDKMILELEQECLEVYRRKVDQANQSRAYLRQAIADVEAELASICSSLGDRPVHISKPNQHVLSLKEEYKALTPQLEEMRKRKSERLSHFLQVTEQIRKISSEVWTNGQAQFKMNVDESDLSTRKLEEFQKQLEALQKEKADRLQKVLEHLSTLNALCVVLGIDFKQTVMEVHPSLDDSEGSKVVSNEVIERLASIIKSLREIKLQRMQKLQDLAASMLELWNLMDTPFEEQQIFQSVTCNVAASEHEITDPNFLSADFLNYVEAEVVRLEELKASKMKELVLKKKTELEELRRRTHLIENGDDDAEISAEIIEVGAVEPCLILERFEAQISGVKEEAFSRKDILEKVEKWMSACEEEAWLEEYNRDENRYSAGRGVHLALKRAEKARATAQRIPGIVEALCNKIIAWENERGTEFTYDGVRLLSMLEEYTFIRQEKEEERKRQRDHKKLQSQFLAEQEALFGSKPSPSKPQSAKKAPRISSGFTNRRMSLGGAAATALQKQPDFACIKASPSTKRGNEFTLVSPAKKQLPSMNVLQPEPPRRSLGPAIQAETPRKPFAPLPVHANGSSNLPSTPVAFLQVAAEEVENRAPQSPQPVPKTPAVVIPRAATVNEMEYSFEERRLAVYLQRSLGGDGGLFIPLPQ